MPLVPTGDLVEQARLAGRAVAAFNVITLEHAEGIALGAERAGLPVILQLSENAVRFHGSPHAIAAASAAVARNSTSDISLHLDHITDMSLLQMAPELDVSSVMYDGSDFGYAENVRHTREAADWGRARGIWIEAELGKVGGKDGAHAPGVRTDPEEALQFVDATGVAALAVAVGSSHAMTSKSASLDHALIRELSSTLPVPLVLHGSSGVPDGELTLAAQAGMVKINVGTALNIAYTSATRRFLDENPSIVDPRKYIAPSRDAVADTVERTLQILAGAAAITL
ncbi:class II fructose-bisphosphate aldolase [Arthrobacter zhaoxinii]|uniref:class II fructose-bisphosphate aldolase n=1 Tax=Arthrobacter zhaoxinii TaxID=2964616 RepID=UPI0021029424|nr:class II fructose-bisphosphate aldolase [Arthrobacter zhaoxinii]MCQ2000326.1 class II fructose-bisphosphate aldolase family protein [Arthrobacter zhaoxinii]